MDELVEALVAKLAENEAWQDNLTDNERKAALDWAREKLRHTAQDALIQVRANLRTLGLVMGPSPDFVCREDVLRALLE